MACTCYMDNMCNMHMHMHMNMCMHMHMSMCMCTPESAQLGLVR